MFLTALLLAVNTVIVNGDALPKGSIAIPLIRKSDYSAYMAEFKVGTPPQKEYLKMDTGSPLIAFENPNNNVCSLASKPCAEYGTFTNTSSS
jgi:candidapepsin